MRVDRWRAYLFLATALLLLLPSACSVPKPVKRRGAEASKSPPTLDNYAQEVARVLERLEALGQKAGEAAGSTPDRSIPEDYLEAGKRIAHDFEADLEAYRTLVSQPDPDWKNLRASNFKPLLDSCVEAIKGLQDLAHQFSEHSAAVRRLYDHLPANPEDSSRRSRAEPAREYTEHCESLADLFSGVGETLLRFHAKRLAPRVDAGHPAVKVLDFLILERLGPRDLTKHFREYRKSWRGWTRLQHQSSGPAAALRIVALGFTITDRYPPETLKDIGMVVQRCVDQPPGIREIEKMEQALALIEKAHVAGSEDDVERAEFVRAKAVFRLCRAHAAANPEYGIYLAIEAFRQDPQLEQAVRSYLLAAAQALTNKYAPLASYSRASRIYSRALKFSGVHGSERLAEQYREHVFTRALSDFDAAIRQEKFLDAKKILADASKIASAPAEEKAADDKLHEFYRQYAWSLAEKDLDAYLAVCREFVSNFPRDSTAGSMLDSGYIRRLQRRIGDLKTSHTRFRAREIFAIFREATNSVVTEKGAQACQEYLERIQRIWMDQLEVIEDPEKVFPLAWELANLAGWSEEETRRRGAKVVNRIFVKAAYTSDWELLERSIDTYSSDCPSASRPRDLKDAYLRFLSHLDKDGLADKLAHHVANFLREFPDGRLLVEPYIEKHFSGDSEAAEEFLAILESHESSRDGNRPEAAAGGEDVEESSDGDSLASRIGDIVNRLWPIGEETPEGDGNARGGDGRGSTRAAALGGGAAGRNESLWKQLLSGPRKRTPAGRVVIVTGSVGSVFILLLLAAWTLTRGPCRLRWYAVGAIWIGATIGSIVAY